MLLVVTSIHGELLAILAGTKTNYKELWAIDHPLTVHSFTYDGMDFLKRCESLCSDRHERKIKPCGRHLLRRIPKLMYDRACCSTSLEARIQRMQYDFTAANFLPPNSQRASAKLESKSFPSQIDPKMFARQMSALLRRRVYIGLVGACLPNLISSQLTSLLGSSFGLPNLNATFDYVVQDPRSIDHLTS